MEDSVIPDHRNAEPRIRRRQVPHTRSLSTPVSMPRMAPTLPSSRRTKRELSGSVLHFWPSIKARSFQSRQKEGEGCDVMWRITTDTEGINSSLLSLQFMFIYHSPNREKSGEGYTHLFEKISSGRFQEWYKFSSKISPGGSIYVSRNCSRGEPILWVYFCCDNLTWLCKSSGRLADCPLPDCLPVVIKLTCVWRPQVYSI